VVEDDLDYLCECLRRVAPEAVYFPLKAGTAGELLLPPSLAISVARCSAWPATPSWHIELHGPV
jgi:hypothetical protein